MSHQTPGLSRWHLLADRWATRSDQWTSQPVLLSTRICDSRSHVLSPLALTPLYHYITPMSHYVRISRPPAQFLFLYTWGIFAELLRPFSTFLSARLRIFFCSRYSSQNDADTSPEQQQQPVRKPRNGRQQRQLRFRKPGHGRKQRLLWVG